MVLLPIAPQDFLHLFEAEPTMVRNEDIAGEPGTTDLASFACPRPH